MTDFDIGDPVRIDGEFYDADDVLTDPATLELKVRPPGAAAVTHSWPPDGVIVRDETGKLHAIVTPDAAGAWDYRWKATGVAAGAEPGRFLVRPEFLADGWRPSVADVAVILRARTLDAGGMDAGEIGTFTADTRPTAAQVETAITQAVTDVELDAGAAEIPVRFHGSARQCVALRAAARIEVGYFNDDRDIHQALQSDYEKAVKRLGSSVRWPGFA